MLHFPYNKIKYTSAYPVISFALPSNSVSKIEAFISTKVNFLSGFSSLDSIMMLRICFLVVESLFCPEDGRLFVGFYLRLLLEEGLILASFF